MYKSVSEIELTLVFYFHKVSLHFFHPPHSLAYETGVHGLNPGLDWVYFPFSKVFNHLIFQIK